MEELLKSVEEELKKKGIRNFGYLRVRTLEESRAFFAERIARGLTTTFEENDLDKKVDLSASMPGAKTILSVAVPYYHDSFMASGGYFSLYTQGRDYHLVVREILEKVAGLFRGKGAQTEVFADNNALPERLIAYMAGVGEIGRNHLLITPDYGSYVFLGEILTDLELPATERDPAKILDYAVCKDCRNCLKACPTQILGEEYYDTKRCMSYITQNKTVEDEDFRLFKGRLFGCDTCQRACPLNREISVTSIADFTPRPYMRHPDLLAILNLTNAEFRPYQETSSGWRGKKLLQRNALVELMRQKVPVDGDKLPTEYLREHWNRLQNIFNL